MCKKVWPELDILCTSRPPTLADYIETIGECEKVLNMLNGDTQRIWPYAARGHAIPQSVPRGVHSAWQSLVVGGFNRRLLQE